MSFISRGKRTSSAPRSEEEKEDLRQRGQRLMLGQARLDMIVGGWKERDRAMFKWIGIFLADPETYTRRVLLDQGNSLPEMICERKRQLNDLSHDLEAEPYLNEMRSILRMEGQLSAIKTILKLIPGTTVKRGGISSPGPMLSTETAGSELPISDDPFQWE